MKKLMTAFFAFTVIFSMSVLSSCGGHPSNEEVKKILDKEKLDEKDYSKLISYYEAYIDEVTPLEADKKKAYDDDNDEKAEKIEEKINKVAEEYKYSHEAHLILMYASDDEMGKSNVEKYKKVKEKRRNNK